MLQRVEILFCLHFLQVFEFLDQLPPALLDLVVNSSILHHLLFYLILDEFLGELADFQVLVLLFVVGNVLFEEFLHGDGVLLRRVLQEVALLEQSELRLELGLIFEARQNFFNQVVELVNVRVQISVMRRCLRLLRD